MKLIRRLLAGIAGLLVLGIAGFAIALSHTAACTPAPTQSFTHPMRAALYRCYGAADVVKIEDSEKPVPSSRGLLVRVHAVSINPLDWHYMQGEPYLMRMSSGWGRPADPTIGTDFAGTVEAVGSEVTRFKPGDEVIGASGSSFAQYLRIPQSATITAKPANLSFEQAAALPVAGITALQALRDQGQLRPGQKVLINGAGGGVGTFAVQIGKALGGEVTAVTNTANLDLMRSLGADHVIDYTHEDFTTGAQRYDLIVDLSGNHSLRDYRRVLAPRGAYVLAGDTSKGHWAGPLVAFGKTLIVAKFVDQRLLAVMARLNPSDLATLADLARAGKVIPVIDRRYPFDQIADAIRYQQTGHARGKVIVTVE